MDRIGIIMNGVTGRMGYRQHLVRYILALRDEGRVRRERLVEQRAEAVLVDGEDAHGDEGDDDDIDRNRPEPERAGGRMHG